MKILETETELVGKWIYENGVIHGDEVSERIKWLISNQLQRIATDLSGWETLYIDPVDKRLWELTYLNSEMHGGGPQSFIYISNEDAKKKYPI